MSRKVYPILDQIAYDFYKRERKGKGYFDNIFGFVLYKEEHKRYYDLAEIELRNRKIKKFTNGKGNKNIRTRFGSWKLSNIVGKFRLY